MLIKFYTILLISLLCCAQLLAQQNSDDQYRKPLNQVLKEVETKFNVRIKFDEKMVADKWVNYADWRYRQTAEATLQNILTPLDMKVNMESETSFKVKDYEYFRWSVEDGQQKLNALSSLYNDKATWEKRKTTLKQCIYEALKLSPLPARPASKTILANKRTLSDYTVENFAIEIMPGVYIAGSIYKPLKFKGKIPVVLCPDGHWVQHRYRADCQYRCATTARLGTIAVSYDLFGWGESGLQFKYEDHRKSLSQTFQLLSTIRILDYLLTLPEADAKRVAISGGSGGGSLTVLMTALDDRIKLSAPVVSLSSYMYGGCPCESGMPIHLCNGGTNNVEIAAMAAPRPMLVVSDGKDWTNHVPEIEMPYLKKMYGFYNEKDLVQNVHLPTEAHDFGINKRTPLYKFIAQNFGLDIKKITNATGEIDETKVVIEQENAMHVFGDNGERLPANAIKGFDQFEKMFK